MTEGGVVCGFADVAAGIGGLAWDIGEPGAVLLSEGRAQPASFAMEAGGDAASLEISAGDLTLEADLAPHTAEVPLADPQGDDHGGRSLSACAAEVRSSERSHTLRCPGYIARWSSDPARDGAVFRHLAVERGDESFLIAIALGRSGGAGHGEEQVDAWLLEGENAIPFEEALISTQYDGAGLPTRVGLELWPQDADQSSRAAAVRVSGSSLGVVESGHSAAGLFGCHVDGSEGFGSYLIWRA
jgi:hypothetical protein